MIAVTIMIELEKPIIYAVSPAVTIVRFICLTVIHFQLANEYAVAMKCLKYLALHMDGFKFQLRAFLALQIAIIAVLATEVLSIKYIMI